MGFTLTSGRAAQTTSSSVMIQRVCNLGRELSIIRGLTYLKSDPALYRIFDKEIVLRPNEMPAQYQDNVQYWVSSNNCIQGISAI